ncbi:MAG: complex I subunit 5 family protein [Coriobacteriia bacterium]|nr:complex I subunit 5 family protein [Coriobacteriia bacterium]
MDGAHVASEVVHTAAEVAHVTASPLPVLLVLVPLLGAALVYPLGRRWPKVRDAWVVVIAALTLLGATGLIPLIAEHHRVESVVHMLIGTLSFSVDSFSMLFAVFTSFIWLASTLYSLDYLKHEQKHDRYHTTSLVVLAAMLGVVLAGDLITLYLCFEALGLVAFLFVIHTETDDAKKASIKYFWMTVVGGFALIGGIFLTFALGGTGAIGPLPAGHGDELIRWAAAIMLILGFGVKAGMVPVHVWLPDAHPVAPSPASALLSGVMIKAGAYGIFRVVTGIFRPEVAETIEESLWHFSEQLGLAVLWIGIATMAIGVFLALQQSNAKRMLAYHSVSQMGFILAGIGAAGYLGSHGAMGVAGGLFHVVNHALFKACLFLGVGAVYFRTHSLDMYHLGGLWKKMPLTFLFTLIAAMGITGVPLLNGFVSKCLIHHAIVEAWEYRHLASLGIAEKIYIVTCGGTAASFIKLIGLVFLGKPKVEYGPEVKDAPKRMLVAMAALSVAIITLGLRPQILLKGVFQPGLHTWGLHGDLLDYYLEHYFLSPPDLMSVVVAFALGFTIFFVGMRFGLFHLHGPKWLSIDWWYRRLARGLIASCVSTDRAYEAVRSATSRFMRRTLSEYGGMAIRVGRRRRLLVATLLTGAPGARDQHFIQHAYVTLERERQDAVRRAVAQTIEKLHSPGDETAVVDETAYLDAVRDIAGYMAQRLMTERMGVLSDLTRTGDLQAARAPFEAVRSELTRVYRPIAETAIANAPRRMRGESVTREVAAAVNAILSNERFDLLIASAIPQARQALGQALEIGASVRHGLPPRSAIQAARADGLSALERAAAWSIEMLALVVDALTRERTGRLMDRPIDETTVLGTRLGIQRYARDIGLNVTVLLVLLLAFIGALALR